MPRMAANLHLDGPALVRPSYVLRSVCGVDVQRYHVYQERMTIGSGDCDVVVSEPGVSRLHAEVLFRDGIVGVRDLDSASGTWMAGKRVHRSVLRPGRTFRVGSVDFEILDVKGGRGAKAQKVDELDPATRIHTGGGGSAPKAAPAQVIDAQVVRAKAATVAPISPANGLARQTGPARSPLAPVFIAEADPTLRSWLASALQLARPVVVDSAAALIEAMQHTERAVLILGRSLRDMSVAQLVTALPESEGIRIIGDAAVEAAGADVFYRIAPGMRESDLLAVVRSAALPTGPIAGANKLSGARAWSQKQIFDICASVSARPEAEAAAAAIEQGIAELFSVARVLCVFHDGESGELWTDSSAAPIDGNAATGIVGFVARTCTPVHAPVASSDPRYDVTVDDPHGTGNEAILAVPAASGRDVHAVLVAVRERAQGFFEKRECMALAELGRELGPILARVAKTAEAEDALMQLEHGRGAAALFREEALQAQANLGDTGEAIRIAPGWSRAMYWALLGMLVIGVIGMAVGRVNRYSNGPAVVRQHGRSELAALAAGPVASIEVEPGQRVRKGQVLAKLRDVSERANYDSTREDFHSQLRERLLDPTAQAPAQQVRTLKRQLDSAEASLEQRVVRAPHDGIVTDVHVQAGQHVNMGDVVMAVVDESDPGLEVVAFLPGADRPQIEPGMPMRLSLAGFEYAYQDVIVEEISEGVVGPSEAKRMLGPQLADTLPLGGGVVMVRARLAGQTFVSDDEVYPFHDGMGGEVDVRLDAETILEMLIPALKEL